MCMTKESNGKESELQKSTYDCEKQRVGTETDLLGVPSSLLTHSMARCFVNLLYLLTYFIESEAYIENFLFVFSVIPLCKKTVSVGL